MLKLREPDQMVKGENTFGQSCIILMIQVSIKFLLFFGPIFLLLRASFPFCFLFAFWLFARPTMHDGERVKRLEKMY